MASADSSCPVGTPYVKVKEALWGFKMEMGGPATALSLFFLFTIVITLELIAVRNRNTKYMSVLVLAGLAEGGAYGAAVHTVRENCESDLFDAFLASQAMILLVPNLIEASMYATMAKMSAFGKVPRTRFWLKPAFLTWFYSMADVATIVVQAIGIGIWGGARTADSTNEDAATAGAAIVVIGLGLQILSQSIFFLESLYVQWRIDQEYSNRTETRALFFSVYWIWGFLQIRNIYRLVAFIQRAAGGSGTGGGGAGEEQPALFTLEALMMVMTLVMFALFPPSYLLPQGSSNKAEKLQKRHPAGDVEKQNEHFHEGYAPANVPDHYRKWMLWGFERSPWLGRVFPRRSS